MRTVEGLSSRPGKAMLAFVASVELRQELEALAPILPKDLSLSRLLRALVSVGLEHRDELLKKLEGHAFL